MGETVELAAADGHRLAAYLARPETRPSAGLVVCQEVFGVNEHIRRVTDGFAQAGYLAVAPALFDRAERGVELGYEGDDLAKGRSLRGEVPWDRAMADVEAAAKRVAGTGKTAVVGYCWGGSLAWLAACRLSFDAAVGYYGGNVHEFRGETPRCPTLLHFGEQDAFIPMDHVAELRASRPEVEIHSYPADHGFNCDSRGSYEPESAKTALERTLSFFERHLSVRRNDQGAAP